ncbi:MAG TPA: GNAT family N-acetyltransferase [Solirubrobacterales bacterium]|nr:GNAT family N-acetyltransferase [Solirubrobacterales bacterium]
MAYPQINPADPGEEGVRALILAQLEYGRAASPPEDAHALEPEALGGPGVALFAAREGEAVLAIGALVRLDDEHGELKAMHTIAAARGRGLGRAMLARLLAEARRRGYRRVSLETGAMAAFAPARALYESAGFVPCPPFADYVASANSVYLSLPIVP